MQIEGKCFLMTSRMEAILDIMTSITFWGITSFAYIVTLVF